LIDISQELSQIPEIGKPACISHSPVADHYAEAHHQLRDWDLEVGAGS
jgi:hypothetical protein